MDRQEAGLFLGVEQEDPWTNCVGVPYPKGDIILITDACDAVGECYPILLVGASSS